MNEAAPYNEEHVLNQPVASDLSDFQIKMIDALY